MSRKILLVEDEEMLSLIIKDLLVIKKFTVEISGNGKDAIRKFDQFKPNLVVLDIMIPGISGYEVATYIRKKNSKIPIIFLSAKSQTSDVLKGFEIGGNDYLKKPFSMEELLARIEVLFNSSNATDHKVVTFSIGNYLFDYSAQQLVLDGHKTTISYRESQVLKYLAGSMNEVVEKSIVLNDLWGDNSVSNSRNMDVVITKLRQHLSGDPTIKILNTRGIGYKLVAK